MNYLDEVLRKGLQAEKGKVSHLTIAHDDWCDIYNGGSCNCNPDVDFGKPSPEKEREFLSQCEKNRRKRERRKRKGK